MQKDPKINQHPMPTVAAIKELYANAYRCAFPGCVRPLYKVDSETGMRTLNSNAAHICARSEGGPRWDPTQSESENRSVGNLLALCLEHAKEIDDPKRIGLYSKETLLKWQRQQLADFDALGRQGWSLRTEDIEKLNQNFNRVETAIGNHSVINLGGKGGSAPGAGGGGGGVLGSINSRAGDGGTGGDVVILDGADATAPGAGGGGGGSIGDGAIASEGGGGGERVVTTIPVESFDSLEFQVGEGGKAGKAGGDTTIRLLKDGKVVRTIKAKGGKAGKPGRHGDLSSSARSLTIDDMNAGAHITSILLVDFFRFKNGLVTLLDAGWDAYRVASLPQLVEWPVYLAFSSIGLRAPTVISAEVRVRDPKRAIMSEHKILFAKLNSDVVGVPWAEVFKFEVKTYGMHTVEVTSGDILVTALHINVLSG